LRRAGLEGARRLTAPRAVHRGPRQDGDTDRASRSSSKAGSGQDSATHVYWGQGGHVWNNTGTENAYLLDANGTEVTKKSCR
jgi:hypothetical protein